MPSPPKLRMWCKVRLEGMASRPQAAVSVCRALLSRGSSQMLPWLDAAVRPRLKPLVDVASTSCESTRGQRWSAFDDLAPMQSAIAVDVCRGIAALRAQAPHRASPMSPTGMRLRFPDEDIHSRARRRGVRVGEFGNMGGQITPCPPPLALPSATSLPLAFPPPPPMRCRLLLTVDPGSLPCRPHPLPPRITAPRRPCAPAHLSQARVCVVRGSRGQRDKAHVTPCVVVAKAIAEEAKKNSRSITAEMKSQALPPPVLRRSLISGSGRQWAPGGGGRVAR